MVMKIFRAKGFPLKKIFITIFEFIEQFYFQNGALNSKKSFQSLGSEYSLKTDLEVSKGAFLVFLEFSLRMCSRTRGAEKNLQIRTKRIQIK
jgi:hypothetical protein